MTKKKSSLAAKYEGSGPASWGPKWYAKGINLYPLRTVDFENIQNIVKNHILPGYVPSIPMLSINDNIITLGSCFAEELRKVLMNFNISSKNFWVPSGLNNTFALSDFVSWCITGKQTEQGYSYDRDEDGQIREWMPKQEREEYQLYFKQATAFIFTFGLAEVWEDKNTNKVFWRGVPEKIFNADNHVFRLTTVDENYQNMRNIIKLIRNVNPNVPIVYTLSPVPLKATFRPVSCMTADCVSKSILRIALDKIFTDNFPNVFYWPSFEMVKCLGCHIPEPAYGKDDGVSRHVSQFLVSMIIKSFIDNFFDKASVEKMGVMLNTVEH